jgi:hypothetical protein
MNATTVSSPHAEPDDGLTDPRTFPELCRREPPQDGDLLFRRVMLPLLLQAFSPLLKWGNAFSISS